MTAITLYNTRTRRKEAFAPLDDRDVRMYVCGPTVYDRAHIGNARPVIVFDVLYRLLREVYGPEHVTYVRNFTDVDDKINTRAAESGRTIGEITEETTSWFLEDMAAVGALEPSIRGKAHQKAMPRATAYIAEMVAMIEDLIAKDHAYAAEGHVLFRVRSYADYGKLSGRSVDDMIAGARVEVAPFKEDPMDFVLWKPSDEGMPGWDSPWGRGRPGWHIECSAMAHALLGERFDIHGGGNDLTFPHHENEIAQSRCAGHDFADVWMHNEMLQVEGKKMSKSLGNFFTVRDLLLGKGPGGQPVPGEVIRFVFLSTHYRKPMDWTEKKRREAQETLDLWTNMLSVDHAVLDEPNFEPPAEEIVDALSDDLNTSLALTKLRSLYKFVNNSEAFLNSSVSQQYAARRQFVSSAGVLGLDLVAMAKKKRSAAPTLDLEHFELKLAYLRIEARESNDFSKLDELKNGLVQAGVEVRMSKETIELVAGSDFDECKLKELG